jgi:metal-responsive CopG/Arc/MetJ family transcriptional regulator
MMYPESVRTTVTLDDDVAAAVDRMRRERSIGLSEAVNELARAGLRTKTTTRPFRQRTADLGLRIDVTNVAEALELLEGPEHR